MLDGDIGFTLKTIEPFDRWTPFTVDIRYIEDERVHAAGGRCASRAAARMPATTAATSRLKMAASNRGFTGVWPGNAIGVRTTGPVPAQKWQHLTAHLRRLQPRGRVEIYLNGTARSCETAPRGDREQTR